MTTVSGRPSRVMQAILVIAADPAVTEILRPILDVADNEIQWDRVDYGALSGSEKAALSWARAIWSDSRPPERWRDPFEGFGIMNRTLQHAVVMALLIRHGHNFGKRT